jgi:predicted TPR repeat methyltransferase
MTEQFERAKTLFFEGIGHFEAGRFEAAEAAFAASLACVPGRASTLANLGAARTRLGRWNAALDVLDQALALEPTDVDAESHRGIAHAALGRHAEALASHQRVLAIDPSRIANRLRHGQALMALGRHAAALDDFDEVLRRQAHHAEAHFQRGQALQFLERHGEALAAYEQALAFEPTLGAAWSQRGGLLRDQHRLDEAAVSFEQAIANGADPELNGYFLASVTGRGAPAAAPLAYVEPFFDEYADAFEGHLLGGLHYEAHTTLVHGLHGLDIRHFGAALDLGCGTGLCGPLVAPTVDLLDGVDLSRNMLEKARRLGVYRHLIHAEIAEHMRRTDERYDLVLSADVFIYIGDLEEVFKGLWRVVDPNGIVGFSVEVTDDDRTFQLLPSLRYAHSERYLRELATRHGFTPCQFLRRPLREDQRRPVPGLFVYLQKD